MAKTIALKEFAGDRGHLPAGHHRDAAGGRQVGEGMPRRHPPRHRLTLSGVKVDPDQLAKYCDATGQRFGDTLPLMYLFVLQFPLVMKLLVAGDFPLTAIGSVHVENTIERFRPIGVTEPLTITDARREPARTPQGHAGRRDHRVRRRPRAGRQADRDVPESAAHAPVRWAATRGRRRIIARRRRTRS